MDLDFEPRWVTKDANGRVFIWDTEPRPDNDEWFAKYQDYKLKGLTCFKLSEFDGKDWTECIYEVPRWDNPDGQILKLQEDSYYNVHSDVLKKINELVDAVNELKARTQPITLNPDLTDEDLRKMMCDPKYWRDNDSATIQKVQNGFNKLYGDKN